MPWHIIVDADGKTLITSNQPEDDSENAGENIGHPGSSEGIVHFLAMLKDTASRQTADVLVMLRTDLESH